MRYDDETTDAEDRAALMDTYPYFETKASGTEVAFTGGGFRDSEEGRPRFDLIRPVNVPYQEQLLTRWAALMARGAKHRGDRNWEKMSDRAALERFISGATRHFEQWVTGEHDEDHAAAVLFNIQGALYVQGVIDEKWEPLT